MASAAPLQQARVSQVIQDVRLLEPHATPRPAVVNDKVTLGRAVRTGVESRAELTFTDFTLTRLGANTIFSLTAGAREIDLTNGTILVQVPAKAAPVKINTASVTVGITGGTALLSTGPPLKFMVLEGVGTIYPKGHPEKAVTVHSSEMVMVTADGRITQPTEFDVKLVLETALDLGSDEPAARGAAIGWDNQSASFQEPVRRNRRDRSKRQREPRRFSKHFSANPATATTTTTAAANSAAPDSAAANTTADSASADSE